MVTCCAEIEYTAAEQGRITQQAADVKHRYTFDCGEGQIIDLLHLVGTLRHRQPAVVLTLICVA